MSEPASDDFAHLQAGVKAALRAAEEAWKLQDPARLRAAVEGCDTVLKTLPPERVLEGTKSPDPADPLAKERTLLWLWRGRFLVMADQPEVVVQGLHSLDQALARLQSSPAPDAAEAAAIGWMNRGSGLFRLGSRDTLAEAVRSYDQAIELLERSPAGPGNALGVSLMNRGVGLLHLDEPNASKESAASRLAEAAKSLERAVAVLEPLAATQSIAQRNLASAWANLGMVRTRRDDPAGALAAQKAAVELFRPLAAGGGFPETFELAARLYNLGQAAGAAADSQIALESGREALALAGTLAAADAQASELALRTRHALCVVLGGMLAAAKAQTADDASRAARLEEAGDLVEDGLAALAARGDSATPGEKAAGTRLYEFGSWFYRTQQPQFLGEFLLEHLGDDADRARIATASVSAARQAFVQRNFNDTTHGSMDRVLDVLQDLGEVELKLKSRSIAG